MTFCQNCGGERYIDRPCPHCGLVAVHPRGFGVFVGPLPNTALDAKEPDIRFSEEAAQFAKIVVEAMLAIQAQADAPSDLRPH